MSERSTSELRPAPLAVNVHVKPFIVLYYRNITGPGGAMAMLSVNELVGTGFASRYWLQHRTGV